MNQVKIGKFIAEMRKQQNLTQREFADILGISDKTVSKWECGNEMPEFSFMQPICKILKINLNELFSDGHILFISVYQLRMVNFFSVIPILTKNGIVLKSINAAHGFRH